MKATIERAALLKSLGHVQSVVERRNTIPILSNVLIEAKDDTLSLTATDMDLTVIDRIPAIDFGVIESDDGAVIPVDYKRGKRPHVPQGAYEPERVQLCVQGLILVVEPVEEALTAAAPSLEKAEPNIN